MAARFGAQSPASMMMRFKWIVLSLFLVIIALITTVVALVAGGDGSNAAQAGGAGNIAPQTSSQGLEEILVATRRIESGQQIQPDMIKKVPMAAPGTRQELFRGTEELMVVGKFATVLIQPDSPLSRTDIANDRPMDQISIPPGFRAVTITVDARSMVDFFARPNSRVDILWTYQDPSKETKVITIVRFVKILSVAGNTGNAPPGQPQPQLAGAANVTLLVSEKDAKKVELARNLGSISLSLVGETTSIEPGQGSNPDEVTVGDLIGKKEAPTGKPKPDGVMESVDSKTGRKVIWELRNGSWSPKED